MTQTEVKLPWPDWKIAGFLGGGSFGAVYEVHRNIFESEIEKAAVKVISVPKDRSDAQELLSNGYKLESINQRYLEDLKDIVKEYSMMAKLKGNSNIVYCDDLYYAPKEDGIGWTLYIRMELLTPLTKVLTETVNEAQVIRLGMDLCNALSACKRNNILHRDIKPANIMVGKDGSFKLGDFGVAKTTERTAGGTKTGTYNYMAPEVYNNQPYGLPVDIYSTGMVMYWMLNERCGPFLPLPPTVPSALQLDEAKQRRFSGAPLPPPVHGSKELKRIVLKACAYDPAQRYASPEALYADLAALRSTGADDEDKAPGPDSEGWRVSPPPVNDGWSSSVCEDDKSMGNSWGAEYEKTQGSVSGSASGTEGGGTVDGGGSSGSHIGPFDIRGQLQLTSQELASGCVKLFTTGSGKKINVTVKAGTAEGTVLRLAGAGRQDAATGARGDAYVTVMRVLDCKGPGDFWESHSQKCESQSIRAGVISSGKARTGGIQSFTFKDGTKKTVQIPAGCKNGQIVEDVKIYVHDFSTGVKNMRDLPDAVLEMYASKSSGIVSGVVIAFVLWMIIGMTTMQIPIMAVGLMIHMVVAVVCGLKKKQVIDDAARILKTRQKQQAS